MLQIIFASSFLNAQCDFPTFTPSCTNLATLESAEADLTNLVCDGSASMAIDVSAGGLYRIVVADGNNYSFSLVPSGNNTADPIFPGTMNLFHTQAQTAPAAATSGPVAASAGMTPTTLSYLVNPSEDNELFLAVFDKSCAGNWKDYTLTITCTTCAISTVARQHIAANQAGCLSAAATFAAPVVSGPCDNATMSISNTGGTNATLVNGVVTLPEGLAANIYTIEFTVNNCSSAPLRSTTDVVVEPSSSCHASNITLSTQCTTQISPSVVLSNQCAADDQYTVFIDGVMATSVTAAGTYNVSVNYTPTTAAGDPDLSNPFYNKNLCWQTVTFEDKTGPMCNLATEDLEYNFVCGFDGVTATPTFTDCSGTITPSAVLETVIGNFGEITGITNGNNNLLDDFDPVTNTLEFMGMDIPAPTEAEAGILSNMVNMFSLERIIKRTFSATDGANVGTSCEQFIYIWRPTIIREPNEARLTCNSETTTVALASFDPQLVPHYLNPLFDGMNDTSTDNDFQTTNIAEMGFSSTLVDDNGNAQFVSLIGSGDSVCNFTTTNTDDPTIDACGSTTTFVRRYSVLDCCSAALLLDNVSQLVTTVDNIAPTFSPKSAGSLGTITNPEVIEISSSDVCTATFDFNTIRPTATDVCSEPVTYNVSFFGLASDFSGAGTFITSGLNPTLDKGNYRADLTATDACGNISIVCPVFLQVDDNIVPSVICRDISVSVDSNGNASVCASMLSSANDNCGMITNLQVKKMGDPADAFADCVNINCSDATADANGDQVVLLEYRATDACGNTNVIVCPAMIEISAAPRFTCPPTVSVECVDFNPLSTDDINGVGPTIGGQCGQMFTTSFTDAAMQPGVCAGSGIILRTYDLALNGNTMASCTQTINITNTSAPVFGMITSPINAECDNIPNGSAIVASNACQEGTPATVTFTDVRTDGSCTDEFTITRTFTATDDCGNMATTTQVINVSDSTAPSFDVIPSDISVDCNNVPAAVAITAVDNCDSDVTVTVSDSAPMANACPNDNLFIRTFTAVDNCGNMTVHTQNITVQAVPILVEFAPDATLNCDQMDAFEFTPPTITEPGCLPTNPVISGPVIQTSMMDANNNVTVTGTFTVTDDCGINTSGTTTITFTGCCPELNINIVRIDNSCNNGIGDVTVITNSTVPMSNIVFRLINSTANPEVIVGEMIGNNVFSISQAPDEFIAYRAEVFEVGNEPPSSCPIENATFGFGCSNNRIAGRIFNEEFVSIENVEVELMNTEIPMSMTNTDGIYSFEELTGQEYTVTASKENDPTNGISTFDLVVMAQHVLGIQKLSTPYKLIAADVNMDETIDVFDMLELRELILFSIHDFTVNNSWRFIDASYEFPDPRNPWLETIPTSRTMDLDNEDAVVDFIAVKIGDMDCSAQTKNNVNSLEERTNQTFVLTATNQTVKAGTQFEVSLNLTEDIALSAAQFTLNFDATKAVFNNLTSEILGLKKNNINEMYVDQGLVPFAWYTQSQKNLDADANLVLTFTAIQDLTVADLFDIDSELTAAAAFASDGTQYDIQLNIQDQDLDISLSIALHQNQPNPFKGETVIGFELPSAQPISITIFDIDGKLLYTRALEGAAGYNTLALSADDIAQSGVLFYQLNTSDYSVTKKMIVLD